MEDKEQEQHEPHDDSPGFVGIVDKDSYDAHHREKRAQQIHGTERPSDELNASLVRWTRALVVWTAALVVTAIGSGNCSPRRV